MVKELLDKVLNCIRELLRIPFEKKKSSELEKIKKATQKDFKDLGSGNHIFEDEKDFYKLQYPKDHSYGTDYYHATRPPMLNFPPVWRLNDEVITWVELDMRGNIIRECFTNDWVGLFSQREFLEIYTNFAIKHNTYVNIVHQEPMFNTVAWFRQTEYAILLNKCSKNVVNNMTSYYDDLFQLGVIHYDLDILALLVVTACITVPIISINNYSGLSEKIINLFTNIFS